jgi:hypothetical protein
MAVKCFYSTGPRSQLRRKFKGTDLNLLLFIFQELHQEQPRAVFRIIITRAQSYKTFYVRNLRVLIIS